MTGIADTAAIDAPSSNVLHGDTAGPVIFMASSPRVNGCRYRVPRLNLRMKFLSHSLQCSLSGGSVDTPVRGVTYYTTGEMSCIVYADRHVTTTVFVHRREQIYSTWRVWGCHGFSMLIATVCGGRNYSNI